MNKRHEELIHRLIDGELTGPERAELEACLASSPAARAFHERMILLQRAGEGRIDLAPPQDLKVNVMNRIQSIARRPVTVSRPWWESLGALWAVFTPRLAYGLAAGVILGFAIGAMSFTANHGSSPTTPTLDFSGTLGLPAGPEGSHVIDKDNFAGEALSLKWSASQSGDLVLINIEVHAATGASLSLVHDPESVVCQAIERVPNGEATVKIEPGTVAVTDAQNGTYAALLSAGTHSGQSVDLHVIAGDDTYRHTIVIK